MCDTVGVLKEETVFLKQFQNTLSKMSIRTESKHSLVDSLTVDILWLLNNNRADIFCLHLYVLSFALNKVHGILLA